MNIANYNKSKSEQTAIATKYPQGYFRPKACKICSKSFTPTAPSEHYCSDTCKDYSLKDKLLKRNYGISLKEYNLLHEKQNHKCKICGSNGLFTAVIQGSSAALVVDHCHSTGQVRGLLCHTCNTALGNFKDSKDLLLNAINYLEDTSSYLPQTEYDIKVRSTDISNTTVLSILIDHLDNSMPRATLVKKYNLTEGSIRGIIELKTLQSKKAMKKYNLMHESATTIPLGSTSEANADGSGSPLIEDDIVSSI